MAAQQAEDAVIWDRIKVQQIGHDKFWCVAVDRDGGELVLSDPQPYAVALIDAHQDDDLPVVVERWPA